MLRTASQDVEFLICRPEPGILPALPTPLTTVIADTQPPLRQSTSLEIAASTPDHHQPELQLHLGVSQRKTAKYLFPEVDLYPVVTISMIITFLIN